MNLVNFIAAILLAFTITAVLTLLVRFFARRLGIVSMPNPIVAQHTEAVAYLGGLAIALGILFTLVPLHTLTANVGLPEGVLLPLITGTVLFTSFGIVDDFRAFRAFWKLRGQCLLLHAA